MAGGRIITPQELPKTQVLLIQLIQQNQQVLSVLTAQAQLLEVLARAALGQSEEDIDFATGLSFPTLSDEEKDEVRERRAEAQRQAAEDRRLMEEAAEDAAAAEVAEATEEETA